MWAPLHSELSLMKTGANLIGMLNPFDSDGLHRIAGAGLTSFALEAAPRTTRAQSMDVLSSSSNKNSSFSFIQIKVTVQTK